ncbi:chorion protein S19 [Drosophila busckii]|uniref:chorion protein S19 n=1 Tax=Drosophila busckii TaxID=30019 RepID=UPI00083F507E|nr:chorion protein S19 [Drosophila busckii]
MNKFATFALVLCACLAIGNAHAYGSRNGYSSYGNRGNSGYGQQGDGSAAAASAAAAGGNNNRNVDYSSAEPLRPILLNGGYQSGHGHGYNAHQISHRPSYGSQRSYGGYGASQRGYGGRPRWSVQPAGATLLYPGQNHYRAYVSPVEYSKVVLPIRAAAPVAKLYVPENNYGSQGGYGQHQQASYGGHSHQGGAYQVSSY